MHYGCVECQFDCPSLLQTSPGREKGRIPLADVRAVEEVDSEALGNKPNALQVSDQDTAGLTVIWQAVSSLCRHLGLFSALSLYCVYLFFA